MHYNMQSVTNNQIIKTNVCIIGSGPAGMTLANEFSDGKQSVVVLESGDDKASRYGDDLNKGFLSGMLNQATHEVRARQVGGTANHWIVKMAGNNANGFRFVPLQPLDFATWPLSREEIDPYYERLHHLLNLGPFAYDNLAIWKGNTQGATLTNQSINSGIFSFCGTDYFTKIFPAKLQNSPTHHLYRNATVSELITSTDGSNVLAAKVLAPNGNTMTVEADQFILAASGFGVPQILLNSKSQCHPDGLGNNNDVVGRYYIDHSLIFHGYFKISPNMHEKLKFYDMRDINGVSVIGSIGLPEALKKQENLQNLEAMLFPKPNEKNYNAFKSVQEFAWAIKQTKPMEHSLWRNTVNLVKGLPYLIHIAYQKYFNGMVLMPGLATGGWSKLSPKELDKRYQIIELMGLAEQRPKKTNRVTLSNTRDALGMPRIAVHMDWDETDTQSIIKTEKKLVEGLQAQGFGEFHSYHEHNGNKLNYYSHTCHHLMGTARMGNDPTTSVVDSNCKIHGVNNCYIASSAVFPSGGYANPTMTMLALCLRLADHLKSSFTQS